MVKVGLDIGGSKAMLATALNIIIILFGIHVFFYYNIPLFAIIIGKKPASLVLTICQMIKLWYFLFEI